MDRPSHALVARISTTTTSSPRCQKTKYGRPYSGIKVLNTLELSSSNFPGEDVSSLSTLVFKYSKILIGAYNLHTNLATKLCINVQKTETEIFNRNILELYRVASKMMLLDSRYLKYGPV